MSGTEITAGIQAITQARQAIAGGLVHIPEGDLITQAMWHLAAEGVQPRLERLALAGALIAMEIDAMPIKPASAAADGGQA